MENKSLLRVMFVSAIGQIAWWIGWYGPEHPFAVLTAIVATAAVIALACGLYARWQSRGYKRQSVREKIPATGTIGTGSETPSASLSRPVPRA